MPLRQRLFSFSGALRENYTIEIRKIKYPRILVADVGYVYDIGHDSMMTHDGIGGAFDWAGPDRRRH